MSEPMSQTGTEADVKPAPAKASARKPGDMTWRQALIVLGGTGAIAVAIGLLPHFAG